MIRAVASASIAWLSGALFAFVSIGYVGCLLVSFGCSGCSRTVVVIEAAAVGLGLGCLGAIDQLSWQRWSTLVEEHGTTPLLATQDGSVDAGPVASLETGDGHIATPAGMLAASTCWWPGSA